MLSHAELRKLRQRAPSDLLEATVQDPALTDDGWLRVELDGAPGAVHECPWPQYGAPAPGDAAVVMESDAGNYWVMVWWAQS